MTEHLTTIPTELTARAIAVALAVTDRGVRKQAAKEGWSYLEKIGKGGRKRMYIVGDLPEKVKLAVFKKWRPEAGDGRQGKQVQATPPAPLYQRGELVVKDSSASLHSSPASGDAVTAIEGRVSDSISMRAGLKPAPTTAVQAMRHTPGHLAAQVVPRLGGFSLIGQTQGSAPTRQDQLPTWAEKIARARADLVAAYWKAREKATTPACGHPSLIGGELNSPTLKNAQQVTDEFLLIYNSGIALPDLFQTLGQVARSTLERWRKDLEEAHNDFTVLAPRWGRHRAGKSVLTETESTIFFKQVLHPHRIKIAKAINLTKQLLAADDIPSPSSSTTFRRVAAKFKSQYFDIWTVCREGEKALFDKVIPYMTRDDSLLEVGDVLVADGHRCNFFVANPWTGKRCRPILVGFYDWKSRDLVGYAYSLNEDTQVIHAALYNAIRRLGKMPRIVLTDNGKAFKSRVFHQRDAGLNRDVTSKEIDLEQEGLSGMYGRLGIQTIFAMPYNARSKPIERFFLEFGESFERYLPAYSGSNIADKPAYLMRNEKMMKTLFESEIYTMPQAIKALDQWLGLYRQTPHPTVKDKRKIDVFEEGRGKGVDEAELRYLMMHGEVKRIDRNGIKFMAGDYYNEALYGLREPVMIRYEFTDVTRIHIYRRNGEFICTAERRSSFHPMARLLGDATDVAGLKQGIAQQRSLKKGTLKIAKAILKSGIGNDLLNQIPYEHLPASVPLDIERIQGEIEAEATTPAFGHPSLSGGELKTGAEIVHMFTSMVEKYVYLSNLKRQLTDEEVEELEECKKAQSVKDFMAMSQQSIAQ